MTVGLALVLAAVVLQGCRGGSGSISSPGGTVPSNGWPALTLEVYGDSLTVADSPSLADGDTGPESWVHHLDQHGLQMTGGSGRWGATAGDILDQHLQPEVSADVLVLFLGTNDLAASGAAGGSAVERHHGQFVDTVDRIAERQDYPPPRVVVVAVGPRDGGTPAPVAEWNRLTALAAEDRGWHLVDPWVSLRSEGNRYADPALTTDGLHLAEAGAVRLAAGMGAELRSVAEPAGHSREHVGWCPDGPARVVRHYRL